MSLSGQDWVALYPTSQSVDDLNSRFRAKVRPFLAAIKEAGGTVSVAATYRPPERAYLMHYASAIARGTVKPEKVPPMAGVDIEWVHPKEERSRAAAKAMARAYDIVYPPALRSAHTEGNAIDMTIRGVVGKTIKNAKGDDVVIKSVAELHEVGASYGVYKLVSDPPHWSNDGR